MISDKRLDQDYWNTQYEMGKTGWDLGTVSPPIAEYIDQLDDRNLSILIPGAGNAYEAEYLLQKGFTDITIVDIAPVLIQKLQDKYMGNRNIKLVHADFFEHVGQYDLILEQTFFCALDPILRINYVNKMAELLKPKGVLAGLLFNRIFEQPGPPFGGHQSEYIPLFEKYFDLNKMSPCKNSYPARLGSELWIELIKRN